MKLILFAVLQALSEICAVLDWLKAVLNEIGWTGISKMQSFIIWCSHLRITNIGSMLNKSSLQTGDNNSVVPSERKAKLMSPFPRKIVIHTVYKLLLFIKIGMTNFLN